MYQYALGPRNRKTRPQPSTNFDGFADTDPSADPVSSTARLRGPFLLRSTTYACLAPMPQLPVTSCQSSPVPALPSPLLSGRSNESRMAGSCAGAVVAGLVESV